MQQWAGLLKNFQGSIEVWDVKLSILIGLFTTVLSVGCDAMVRMPGKSHQGPLPEATDELRALEQELRSHVYALAGDIGERNLFHYHNLVKASEYIQTTLVQFRVSRPTAIL